MCVCACVCVCVCECVYEPRQHTAPKNPVKEVGSALDPLHREQLYVYHLNTGTYDGILASENRVRSHEKCSNVKQSTSWYAKWCCWTSCPRPHVELCSPSRNYMRTFSGNRRSKTKIAFCLQYSKLYLTQLNSRGHRVLELSTNSSFLVIYRLLWIDKARAK